MPLITSTISEAAASTVRAAALLAIPPPAAWKLPPRLPTLPMEIASYRLIMDSPNRIHRFRPRHQSCVVNIRPIAQLTEPPASQARGPHVLRAFLWAREKYPDRNFNDVRDEAMEAVYSSYRVDGLPRIVFGLGKDVRMIVNNRVKVGGVLRHKVKRRAKAAFREALEGERQINPGTKSPS
jgi:hypothetical protein